MNYRHKKKRKYKFSNNIQKPSGRRNRPSKKQNTRIAIDPKLLISKVGVANGEEFQAARSFSELPIHHELKARLIDKGFIYPTEIQEATLKPLVTGRDLLGIANTGTGKTGAFLIPIIEQLLTSKAPVQSRALVVVPTRELALQVEQEFKSITGELGIYCACFIGGTSVAKDKARLRRPHHLTIGTPGRLLDLMNRGDLRLSDKSILVLDEFDRMLDMGFLNDVKKIVQEMPHRQQTMLFSATLDPSQKELIAGLLKNPVVVKVSAGNSATDQVEQDIIHVPSGGDKFQMLLELLKQQEFEKVLLFVETKRRVDKVSRRLHKSGVSVDLIHGDKTQNYRSKALRKFKAGEVKVLVATDVAARGIDVLDITHVINYQLPQSYDTYIHRIGRTGRAGKKGIAFTFVDTY